MAIAFKGSAPSAIGFPTDIKVVEWLRVDLFKCYRDSTDIVLIHLTIL